MANAYRVAANPKCQRRAADTQDLNCDNVEIRRRWTNPELAQRRDLLARLGLCDSTGRFKPHGLGDDLEDDLEDDFEEEEAVSTSTTQDRALLLGRCQPLRGGPYKAWFKEDPPRTAVEFGGPRRRALRALRSLSKSALREARLRSALVQGEPPLPPEIWAATAAELQAEVRESSSITSF
jgi:hypothetical protein